MTGPDPHVRRSRTPAPAGYNGRAHTATGDLNAPPAGEPAAAVEPPSEPAGEPGRSALGAVDLLLSLAPADAAPLPDNPAVLRYLTAHDTEDAPGWPPGLAVEGLPGPGVEDVAHRCDARNLEEALSVGEVGLQRGSLTAAILPSSAGVLAAAWTRSRRSRWR
jgi:hypothetical protein